MPFTNDGKLMIDVRHNDWRGQYVTQEELALAYRPTAGVDRRPRIYTMDSDPAFTGFMLGYIVAERADGTLAAPGNVHVSSFDFALRFRDWLNTRHRRFEFQADTQHEFGRRRFTTLSNDEAIVLAGSTLVEGHRDGRLWRGKYPIY